ncbi:MAG: hypothetical protein ACJ8FY_01480 [Gemmataceae bacterium]
MPIRFRCSYCNQMLGISRRKIGSLVRCPTCAGQIVVPAKSTATAESQAPAGGSVFERHDFDELLEIPAVEQPAKAPAGSAVAKPPKAASPEGAWGTHGEPAFDLEKLYPSAVVAPDQSQKSKGIFLSPFWATVLTVATIFLLAIAFGSGILVGRLLLE